MDNSTTVVVVDVRRVHVLGSYATTIAAAAAIITAENTLSWARSGTGDGADTVIWATDVAMATKGAQPRSIRVDDDVVKLVPQRNRFLKASGGLFE
jgi:hypothetical protein